MDCNTIREKLADFVEDALTGQDRGEVEGHLKRCDACRREHASLKAYFMEMETLDRMNPPPDFLKQVHARIDKPPGIRAFFQSLLVPLHVKLPLELAAMALIALTVVWFVKQPEPPYPVMSRHAPESRPGAAEREETAQRFSGAADAAHIREKAAPPSAGDQKERFGEDLSTGDKTEVPSGIKRDQKEEKQFRAGKGGLADDMQAKKIKGETETRMKKGPRPAVEDGPVELTLIPGKRMTDQSSRIAMAEAEPLAYNAVKAPARQEVSEEPVSRDEEARRNDAGADRNGLDTGAPLGTAGEDEPMAGGEAAGLGPDKEKDEMAPDDRDLKNRIVHYAAALGGTVIEAEAQPEGADEFLMNLEIPAENFPLFIDELKTLGAVSGPALPIPAGDPGRIVRILLRIPKTSTENPSD